MAPAEPRRVPDAQFAFDCILEDASQDEVYEVRFNVQLFITRFPCTCHEHFDGL